MGPAHPFQDIIAYYHPVQFGGLEDTSPDYDAIRKAVRKAVEPFLKLEAGAVQLATQPTELP